MTGPVATTLCGVSPRRSAALAGLGFVRADFLGLPFILLVIRSIVLRWVTCGRRATPEAIRRPRR